MISISRLSALNDQYDHPVAKFCCIWLSMCSLSIHINDAYLLSVHGYIKVFVWFIIYYKTRYNGDSWGKLPLFQLPAIMFVRVNGVFVMMFRSMLREGDWNCNMLNIVYVRKKNKVSEYILSIFWIFFTAWMTNNIYVGVNIFIKDSTAYRWIKISQENDQYIKHDFHL